MTEPADARARETIRTRLDVTMLVEAAAGTGKTTSLVARMVNLVSTGRARASSIAAITFTVKAAAHLRERFQEEIEKAIPKELVADGAQFLLPWGHSRVKGPIPLGPRPSALGPALRAALNEIDRGFIGTTHAFCARLLRERPVEAGLDPEFEELDEAQGKQLTAEFWNRWYDEENFAGNMLLGEAREVGLDRKTLRSAFERVVEYPDVTLVSRRTERPDLSGVVRKLIEHIDRIEPHLPTAQDRDEPDPFERMVVKLLRQRRSADLDDPFEQFAFLDEGNHAAHKPVQKRWPDGPTVKRLYEDYSDFVTAELRPAVQRWREHAHGIALEVLRPAAEAFAAERRRNGTLTFQDLLVCARDMLRDHPGVRRYFQRRFTHVLVDEFQDTDPLQAEVLFYLTGADVNEKNWRNLRPRPGSLFIVGDPKQSIYRFRRADITTYLDVRERIRESGGEVLELSTNFRSAPAICTFVNASFSTMFAQDDVDAGRQAKHIDLLPGVGVPESSGVFLLETADNRNALAMAEAEATSVGQWILRSVGNGLKWSDILLVSWQRPRLACYARVFEKLGIPYEITGSKAFADVGALTTAMPLLHAIADPEDEVSIVAFLRGPLNGADDDALYRFVKAGGRFSPFAEIPEGTDVRIADGLRVIREAIDDAREHPPAAAMARLFDRMGILPHAASGERPGTRTGNLLLALTIARDASARGEAASAIVEELETLIETRPDIEELDIDPSRQDAVRLMNLHQVKGLEAAVVFLIDPADEHDFDTDLFVDRRGEESQGHFVVTRPWGKGKPKALAVPPGWDDFEQTEKSFKRAEKMRLLYVAATRAKRILVVGYRQTARGVKGAWRELAGRIRERLQMPPDITAAAASTPPAARLFAEAQAEITARLDDARTASYSVLPITKIAHDSHEQLVRAEEGLGKGMSWGRVLHRLFEAMLRDPSLDIRLYASNLLKDEERDAADLADVLRVVDAVQGSPLWNRVKASPERYVEIPFALEVKASELGIAGPPQSLLHGTIDLVFREGSHWFIVDYKSDATANRINALTEYYAPQVRLYADFWSRLTGAPASGGLFFVDGLIEKWVT
jgi:ATP-dependent helicase/nuclease subunit A